MSKDDESKVTLWFDGTFWTINQWELKEAPHSVTVRLQDGSMTTYFPLGDKIRD